MKIEQNARKKKREEKSPLVVYVSTSLVKDGKSFQGIWLESLKALIQQNM